MLYSRPRSSSAIVIIVVLATASLVTVYLTLCIAYDSQLYYTPANFVRDHTSVGVYAPLAPDRGQAPELGRAPVRGQASGRSDRTKVLLVAYHRGGSSFLGEIFAQNPAAFYWYEPLRNMYRSFPSRLRRHVDIVERLYDFLPNGSLAFLSTELVDVIVRTTLAVLNCDVLGVDGHVLSDEFMLRWVQMPRMRVYAECMTQNIDNVFGRQICARILRLTCTQTEIVAAKTVRFPVYAVERLLVADPSVKVVYYVRDPRAIMASRADRFGESEAEMAIKAPTVCRQMAEDYRHYERIKRKYPDGVLLVQYEDLARRATDTASFLYRFVGSELPPSVGQWIDDNTRATRSDGRIGTRRNSTATADRWRTRLSRDVIEQISAICREVLDRLNYVI